MNTLESTGSYRLRECQPTETVTEYSFCARLAEKNRGLFPVYDQTQITVSNFLRVHAERQAEASGGKSLTLTHGYLLGLKKCQD